MCWLKRDIRKVGIAIAGMLLLLAFMVCAPVLAAGTHERASGLATPVTGTVQATPTEDATVTALNKEKLKQEVQQLKNQNEPDFLGWVRTNSAILLSTLVVVVGGLIGFFRWFRDRRSERDKRAEGRFQAVVEGLGSKEIARQVGAAIMLRTFLPPNRGYEQFYRQTFDLAVTHLRLRQVDPNISASLDPDDPDDHVPLDSLNQALITVIKDSFPPARKALIGQEKPHYHYKDLEDLDASGIRLDYAFLRHAELEGIWMRDAFLSHASLRKANLSNAYLTKTNLSHAYLRYANLSGARLRDAVLSRAHLDGADLHGAYLASAHLNGADLRDTDLRGVKMSNETDLSGAKLQGAKYNTKKIQEKDGQGDLVTIEPTQWPQKFYPSAPFVKYDNKRVGDTGDDPWADVPRPRGWPAG